MASDMPQEPLPEWRGEIERLWAKVSRGAGASSGLEIPGAPSSDIPESSSTAWETLSLMRRKHRGEAAAWSEMLEAKEKEIAALQERQRLLENEISGLRRQVQSAEENSLEGYLDVQARLEAALASLKEERRRHEEDEKRLRALLEQTRQRMSGEADIWKKERKSWEKKEEKYLARMKEMESLTQARQEDAARASGDSEKLAQGLKEAKNALEKTLAELLRERQVREGAEKERSEALKKVDEVQRHFEELSKIWEEERAQWRELWDRERSTWETQRSEFSVWEEKLRRERQSWHADLKAKEEDHLRFASQMAETLRQSTETTTKIQSVLRAVALLGLPPERRRVSRRIWAGLGAAAVFAAASIPVWKYYTAFHFKAVAEIPASLANPTGMAYGGSKIWVSQWNGELDAFNPLDLNAAPAVFTPNAKPPYHPVSIVSADGSLWTADAAQARLVRVEDSDPGQVAATLPAQGPAPTAMAYDGKAVWCYDAANRSLDRYGKDGSVRSYGMGSAVPTSLLWVSGQLWAFDSKTRKLDVYDFKEGAFTLRAAYDLGKTVVGMTAVTMNGRRQLWILAAPSDGSSVPSFIKFRY
ncbi:MAG: hypothetical protein KGL04_02645 [Elusimicrobia bacterium]|nr:hypothetical protein [Elusimicrobiota bacterium]